MLLFQLELEQSLSIAKIRWDSESWCVVKFGKVQPDGLYFYDFEDLEKSLAINNDPTQTWVMNQIAKSGTEYYRNTVLGLMFKVTTTTQFLSEVEIIKILESLCKSWKKIWTIFQTITIKIYKHNYNYIEIQHEIFWHFIVNVWSWKKIL